MKTPRPEVLAVRAVNQYRRRDVLAYIGLRYYFKNHCTVRDHWGTDVASHLVLSRSVQPYFHSLHFKELKKDGSIEHRNIHLPGPNEALAEAVLLQACAEAGVGLEFPRHVFSYRVAKDDTKAGMFEPYFRGFRSRHNAVVSACCMQPESSVLYTDIRRFYPRISSQLALRVWDAACDRTRLNSRARTLGEKILHDHALVQNSQCAGVLTGPMISHLIGNLVLREVDVQMTASLPSGYFRYVDDIILVGSRQAVDSGRMRLEALLRELGLELHGAGKDYRVSASEWLQGAGDFKDGSERPSWMTFVGGLKHLLVTRPQEREELMRELVEAGIRLPVSDYSEAVWESSYVESFLELAQRAWFRMRVGKITTSGLVKQALILRNRHTAALDAAAEGAGGLEGYQRKRRITKLKYHAGRLVYLAAPDQLVELGRLLEPIPELRFHSEILNAIGTLDVSRLLSFGNNAVQSAAQALRTIDRPVRAVPAQWTAVERQGMAILELNAVDVASEQSSPLHDDEVNRFARWGGGAQTLMRSPDPFIRELACLHGCLPDRRHGSVLDSAFDRDEELAFDAITQERPSS